MSWETLDRQGNPVALPTKTEMDAQRGLPADAIWDGSAASASHTSIFKRIANFVATLGSLTDAAWDGITTNPSNQSIQKRIAALLADPAPAVVISLSTVATASFTRPADAVAYSVNDLVANSATAGSVVPVPLPVARVVGGSGNVRRLRMTTTDTTANGRLYTVDLFKLAPTVTGGDNAAYTATGRVSIYLGSFDVTLDQVFTDGVKGIAVPRTGGEITFDTDVASVNIYALVRTRSAYTPVSGETITLALETFRD